MADALEQAVGLRVERAGSIGTRATPTLRGRPGGDGTLVLMDGKPLPYLFDGRVDLSQIPINIVERIEITRGGSSLIYGSDAAAGTIHIITSRPEEKGLRTKIGTAIGRDGYKNAHGRFMGRSYWGDISYFGSRQVSSGFGENEDHKNVNHLASISRSFNGKGYWGVQYFNQESQVGLGNGTIVPFDQWNGRLEQLPSDDFAQDRQIQNNLRIDLASPQIKNGVFHGTFARSVRDREHRATTDGPALRDQETTSDFAQVRWNDPWFETGVDAELRKRNVYSFGNRYGSRVGGYAVVTGRYNRLTVRPAIRLDEDSHTGSFLAPRLAVLFQARPTLVFSATTQNSRIAPTYEQLFISSGGVTANEALDHARVRSVDAGFRWLPVSGWELEATGFQSRTSDRIGIHPVTSRVENLGAEKIRGVETLGRARMGEKNRYLNISMTASWTFQKATRTGLDVTGEQESPLVPRQIGFVRIDQHLPRRITFTNEIRYQSEQFEGAGKTGVRIPSSSVWNARIGIKVLTADLFFEARNLNRATYAETLGTAVDGGVPRTVLSPQPERTFWLGLAIGFTN